MARSRPTSLSELARFGFTNLEQAQKNLTELESLVGKESAKLTLEVSKTQDPDQSLELFLRLTRNHLGQIKELLASPGFEVLLKVLGSSVALYEFLERHPEELTSLLGPNSIPDSMNYSTKLIESAASVGSIRLAYRKELLRIAIYDLTCNDPVKALGQIASLLAELAGAAIEAGLKLATKELAEGLNGTKYSGSEIENTAIAVIGMGKCGAGELNYISDVDVIYVAESKSVDLETTRALEIATKIVTRMMRIMDEPGQEPPLWQVDANLRPEGKSGALVRTLESHLSYYDRWAESWEFQALLKARPIAGNKELGEKYIASIWPKVWESATRETFVESVQRMRQRVTDNIPQADIDFQIKLGPGGLRDIEFTVQLLQLVHGRQDESVRVRDTLTALSRLAEAGYVGRDDSERFASHYRFLRFLEHRIQLSALRRTHLMPREEHAQRSIARAIRPGLTADELISRWEKVKLEVKDLHQQLFYRPLLSAVSGLSEDELELTSHQAEARLAAIGFQDPRGAMTHISALTGGLSRRAAIQRQLLPVLIQWFADGTDPDAALLAFRRLSEDLGESHWYLKMLRDSSGAAQRMTQVFSNSRLATALFEKIPEAAAWFDREEDLSPTSLSELESQFNSIIARHEDVSTAASSIRAIRRREMLRIAIGAVLGVTEMEVISRGISELTESYLSAMLSVAEDSLVAEEPLQQELAVVAMGRFGGCEMSFGSDADVMFVYRVTGDDRELAQKQAERMVSEVRKLASDQVLEFELDLDLRPEGKNGPVVRSIDSYAAYYERWADSWESQALLRARVITQGKTGAEFVELINKYRYPVQISAAAITEIRRIKARVEVERLPLGADPKRHLKLGRGSISDVEWLVQLFQLKFANLNQGIRTPKTLEALAEMEKANLISGSDSRVLKEAWMLSSRIRSAAVLFSGKRSDVLPVDRKQLEGIARLLGYPRGGAAALEEDYLATTRRSRMVFEKLFFDYTP